MMFTTSQSDVTAGLLAMIGDPKRAKAVLEGIHSAQIEAEEKVESAKKAMNEMFAAETKLKEREKSLSEGWALLKSREATAEARENEIKKIKSDLSDLMEKENSLLKTAAEARDEATKKLKEAALLEETLIARKSVMDEREKIVKQKEDAVQMSLDDVNRRFDQLKRIANG